MLQNEETITLAFIFIIMSMLFYYPLFKWPSHSEIIYIACMFWMNEQSPFKLDFGISDDIPKDVLRFIASKYPNIDFLRFIVLLYPLLMGKI